MTESYLQTVREALETVFEAEARRTDTDPDKLKEELTLRPPKNRGWGDLCTNAVLLLAGDDADKRAQISEAFIGTFQKITGVESVKLADSGYINIFFQSDFWGQQVAEIVAKGSRYGLTIREAAPEIILVKPDQADDLVSARHLWNFKSLSSLAKLSGYHVDIEKFELTGPRGFPTKNAIEKCGEATLRLAVLSNADAFAVNFSPLQAVDKAYANPAFCIPYAHARIKALLDNAIEQKSSATGDELVLEESVQDILYSLPLEQKIAKFLCQWPIAVEQTLRNKDIIYLTAFLQDLSLLFFRLSEQQRLQSSTYLVEAGRAYGRRLLLRAMNILIAEGLDILGVEIVEEFI